MSTKRDLCTTWNGSSEGFRDEIASLQDSQEWGKIWFSTDRNMFKWPWSVSGKGFHIPSIWAKTSAIFCSLSLFHFSNPNVCFPPFLFIITAAEISHRWFFFIIYSRSCCETWSWAASLGDWATLCVWGMTVAPDHPTCCEERWCMNMFLTQNIGKILLNHPEKFANFWSFHEAWLKGDAKWFWLHKKLSSEINIR